MSKVYPVWLLAIFFLAGCAAGKQEATEEEGVPSMQISSNAFHEGAPIPKEYTADGKNVSPPIHWTGAPDSTKSFALVCEDPDAPRGIWTHWVLFNVPPETHELHEGMPTHAVVLGGAKQGMNDFRKTGYGGPDPPRGTHRYEFKVYALDSLLDLPESTNRQQLLEAMKGHILAKGQLMGKYGR